MSENCKSLLISIKGSLKKVSQLFLATLLIFSLFSLGFSSSIASAAGTPNIISYQGRLSNSSGDLLGGSGTTYYFKFSIWDNATVGSGSQLWPASAPTSFTSLVRQGVFNVNIGDTANGYPDTLNYNFNSSKNIYLQVEVSSDNATFETLSPRQQITASAFSKISESVSGADRASSFGTTTPIGNSAVTIEASSTDAIPLIIRAALGQVADLFKVQNSLGSDIFSINKLGNVFSSQFSAFDRIYIGGTATTTIVGNNATSTFSGGLTVTGGGLNSSGGITITGGSLLSTSNATSTLAGGFDLTDGCYSINGTCIGNSGGTITGSGASGQLSFWSSGSAISSDPSLFWDNSGKQLGIGTITPSQKLDVAGIANVQNYLKTSYIIATSSATSTFAGGLYASLVSAPYFHATSTTASSSLQNLSFTNGQGSSLSLSGGLSLGTALADTYIASASTWNSKLSPFSYYPF
ncbi:MAG: hypothetical protein WCW87_03165, partial [Candidatus Paceibacterota bacterium]